MKYRITPQQVTGNYVNFIDLARFVGIACVIYGHCHPFVGEAETAVRNIVYCFHMPLFFLISGFLSKPIVNSGWKYYRKIIFSLFIPYIIYNIPYFPLAFSDPLRFLCSMITASIPPNDPTWFFYALLWVKVLTTLFYRHQVLLLTAAMITYVSLLSYGIELNTMFCGHAILSGIIFFYFGKIFKQFHRNRLMYICIPLSILLVIISIHSFGKYDMYWGYVGNPVLYLLTTISTSFSILYLCKMIGSSLAKGYFGKIIFVVSRGTMIIVGTHYLLAHFSNKYLFTVCGGFTTKLIYVTILLFLYWIIIKATYHRWPVLYGKKY